MNYFARCQMVLGIKRTSRSTARLRLTSNPMPADRSALTVVPEIDHRIGKGLEGVMQPAEAIKAKQGPAELVLPGKHPLDRLKAFLKDRRIEKWLATSLGLLSAAPIRVDVGDHPTIENRLAVRLAIIDAIEANDAALKVHTHCTGDAHDFGQGFTQQR